MDLVEFFRAALSSHYDETESWNRRSQCARPVSLYTGKIVRDPYWDKRCDDAQKAFEEASSMREAFESDPVAFLRDVATKAELTTKAA